VVVCVGLCGGMLGVVGVCVYQGSGGEGGETVVNGKESVAIVTQVWGCSP